MDFFVNNAINDAFVIYLQSKDNVNSLEYNSFMVSVLRMLYLIYGENELYSLFYNKDNAGFDKILAKYGFSEIDQFKNNFELCYEFDLSQQNRAIKKKNKYFNLVQKYLIDMFMLKTSKEGVSTEDKSKFKDLLFTFDSSDFYKKTYALLMAYNPYEIDEYLKKINFMGASNEGNNN